MARVFLPVFLYLLLSLSFVGPASARSSTQTAFSPSPDAVKLVVKTINEAKVSIDVAAYSFTSKPVSEALLAAHQRGVAVRILLDKSQGKRHYKAAEMLRDAGVPIRINRRYAIMHNKYLIIDGKTVETGSFNYTANAAKRNAENVLVIKDNAKIAQAYMENWDKLWNEGEAYPTNGDATPPQTIPQPSTPQQQTLQQPVPEEPKLSARAWCKIVRLAFNIFYPDTWRSSYSSLCRAVIEAPVLRANDCEEPANALASGPHASFLGAAPASPLRRPCAAPASP